MVIVQGEYRGQFQEGQTFASAFIHIWQLKDGAILSLNRVADTAVMPT